MYGFVKNDPLVGYDYLGNFKCKVKSFKMVVTGWSGFWPNWITRNYSKKLKVKFTLVLEKCSNKEDCLIGQFMKGLVKTRDSSSPHPDWEPDGPYGSAWWWDGNSWSAGDGSWSWDGKTATFVDTPGWNTLSAAEFPIYWGGMGKSGHFSFKTQVKDNESNTIIRELTWGMLIDYKSPTNGMQNFFL